MGEGRYANSAEIDHNAYEFIFDFGQVWLDAAHSRICVRVITSPEIAQRIHYALDNALARHTTSLEISTRIRSPKRGGHRE